MGDTWLQLPAQMGGTRFGPFRSGIVQIGSDNAQCQIVLPPHFGVAPVHVTVAIQGPGTYVVQPVQRGFGLFLMKSGGSIFPVASAIQAGAGDTLVLGTPTGPRFTLSYEDNGPSRAQAPRASGAGLGAGLGAGMAREIKRQLEARWMARNPVYRELSRLTYRMRSGSLTSPRALVGLALGGGAAVIALGSVCLGGLGVLLKSFLG